MENLSIPSNWDDVFVDQYIELIKIDPELMIIERNIEILTILTDTEYTDEVWEDMDVDDLNDMMKKLSWVSKSPITNYKKDIGDYKCIDIHKKLTLGQYIDMDYYIGNQGYTSLSYLCTILYRRFKIDDFGKIEFEPYDYDLDERLSFFNELKINEVYGILPLFSDYKKMILDSYQTLFEPQFEDDGEEEEEITDQEELELKKEEETHQKWGWENVLYKLSDGDITMYDKILDLPLIFVLNQLSYMKATGR